MRRAGQICALCDRFLPEPHTPGEKRCESCRPRHRIYMTFFERRGWYCQFLEEDLKTPLPRKLLLPGIEKILEMAERGGAFKSLADRQGVEQALETGRGGVFLELTEEQYRRLK